MYHYDSDFKPISSFTHHFVQVLNIYSMENIDRAPSTFIVEAIDWMLEQLGQLGNIENDLVRHYENFNQDDEKK